MGLSIFLEILIIKVQWLYPIGIYFLSNIRAHSSHVVRVRFNHEDSYLYSVGGYDRTMMKWKVK